MLQPGFGRQKFTTSTASDSYKRFDRSWRFDLDTKKIAPSPNTDRKSKAALLPIKYPLQSPYNTDRKTYKRWSHFGRILVAFLSFWPKNAPLKKPLNQKMSTGK
jgi:hypothetical protein